jgi:hypothetical protein
VKPDPVLDGVDGEERVDCLVGLIGSLMDIAAISKPGFVCIIFASFPWKTV